MLRGVVGCCCDWAALAIRPTHTCGHGPPNRLGDTTSSNTRAPFVLGAPVSGVALVACAQGASGPSVPGASSP
jgi:hypothetical protein